MIGKRLGNAFRLERPEGYLGERSRITPFRLRLVVDQWIGVVGAGGEGDVSGNALSSFPSAIELIGGLQVHPQFRGGT